MGKVPLGKVGSNSAEHNTGCGILKTNGFLHRGGTRSRQDVSIFFLKKKKLKEKNHVTPGLGDLIVLTARVGADITFTEPSL